LPNPISHARSHPLTAEANSNNAESTNTRPLSRDRFAYSQPASIRLTPNSIHADLNNVNVDASHDLVSIRLAEPARATAADNLRSAISGINLSGIDWDKIDSASLKIDIPMEAGRHSIPTNFENARVMVAKDTQAELLIEVEQVDGEPKIKHAKLDFSKNLVILNPASAFEPSDDACDSLWNSIQDTLGDVLLSGIQVDTSGELELLGYIDRPWPATNVELTPDLYRARLPKLNLAVSKIVDGDLVNTVRDHEALPLPLHELLQALGIMTQKGRYEMKMESGPVKLSANSKHFSIESTESPLKLKVSGQLDVEGDGSIHLNIAENSAPELLSGAGELDMHGKLELYPWMLNDMRGHGRLAFTKKVDGVKATFKNDNNFKLPLLLNGADNLVVGTTNVRFLGDEIRFEKGEASASLKSPVDDNLKLKVDGTEVTVDEGKISTDVGWRFEGAPDALRFHDGNMNLKLTASDTHVKTSPLSLRVDGRSEVLVEGQDFSLDTKTNLSSGHGTMTLSFDPRNAGNEPNVEPSPLWWKLGYTLNTKGELDIVPAGDGISEFAAPFLGTRGRPEALVNPQSPAVGALGSVQLKNHLVELTGAPIRKETNVEILVDGIESYPKRLEMIRTAKKSLCLQTLIFKDDETGMKTADELIKATQRGVKVRVLVDALGNVETIEDLTEGKAVYEKLKNAGVEFCLYKDPNTGPFKDLISEIANNEELSKLENIGLLADDLPQALSVMRELVKIAVGDSEVSSETQNRVRSILTRVLATQAGEETMIGTNELATLISGDQHELARWMIVLQQLAELNARWHEKSLIKDGNEVVLGGMNVADEYMLGGSGVEVDVLGTTRIAWRDTDVFAQGKVAKDVYQAFAKNWKHATGEDMPPAPLVTERPETGRVSTQFIQHRPKVDGDHHITNVMIENIKAVPAGEKLYLANAYFCPVGALDGLKTALIDAAQRGVDVRILTNSESTSDLPQINQAASFAYRELLAGGVRIFERTGNRTMHTKMATFGDNTSIIGSWNADNRSASLNSENALIIYDEAQTKEAIKLIEKDMAPAVAKEVKLADFERLPFSKRFAHAMASMLGHLL